METLTFVIRVVKALWSRQMITLQAENFLQLPFGSFKVPLQVAFLFKAFSSKVVDLPILPIYKLL